MALRFIRRFEDAAGAAFDARDSITTASRRVPAFPDRLTPAARPSSGARALASACPVGGAGSGRAAQLREPRRDDAAGEGVQSQADRRTAASGTCARNASFCSPTRIVGRAAQRPRNADSASPARGTRCAIAITCAAGAAPPTGTPAAAISEASVGPCLNPGSSTLHEPANAAAGSAPSSRSPRATMPARRASQPAG